MPHPSRRLFLRRTALLTVAGALGALLAPLPSPLALAAAEPGLPVPTPGPSGPDRWLHPGANVGLGRARSGAGGRRGRAGQPDARLRPGRP